MMHQKVKRITLMTAVLLSVAIQQKYSTVKATSTTITQTSSSLTPNPDTITPSMSPNNTTTSPRPTSNNTTTAPSQSTSTLIPTTQTEDPTYHNTNILDSAEVSIKLSISVAENFTDDLTNPKSGAYHRKADFFWRKLMIHYLNITNFKYIKVYGFRDGSIIADFAVILSLPLNKAQRDNIKDEITNTTLQLETNNLIPDISSSYLHSNSTNNAFVELDNPCKSKNALCPPGYNCKDDNSTTNCQAICRYGICQHDGECYVDNEKPLCRCPVVEKYVYYGDHCEKADERLALDSDYIIAIGAGGGGALILILLISLICSCYKCVKQSKIIKQDKEMDESDDLSVVNGNAMAGQSAVVTNDNRNAYSRYPERSPYSVIRDPDYGSRMYLYQPSRSRSVVSAEEKEMRPDYLTPFENQRPDSSRSDSESAYQIRRPEMINKRFPYESREYNRPW